MAAIAFRQPRCGLRIPSEPLSTDRITLDVQIKQRELCFIREVFINLDYCGNRDFINHQIGFLRVVLRAKQVHPCSPFSGSASEAFTQLGAERCYQRGEGSSISVL